MDQKLKQILIIVICLIFAVVGVAYQIKDSRTDKPSFIREVQDLWERP